MYGNIVNNRVKPSNESAHLYIRIRIGTLHTFSCTICCWSVRKVILTEIG